MKRVFLGMLSLLLCCEIMAQTNVLKKKPSFSLNFALKDFVTPARIKSTSFSQVLVDKSIAKTSDMSAALGVQYLEGLTDHIDFVAGLDVAFLNYPFRNTSKILNANKFLVSVDAGVNVKLLPDNYFFTPYLSGGLGGSMYNATYFSAFNYLGGGMQFRLSEDVFINTQCSYRFKVTDWASDHFQFSLGVVAPITDKKPVVKALPPPAPMVVEKDSDADGIMDSKDKCPTVAGLAKYNGCPIPDTDGDGINDENDKCIKQKGIAKYSGCPIPDTDKDGINDEEDKCITVAGLARYGGCPIPDTDNDGVNDEDDKCPNEVGTNANNGCPEIQAKIAELAKQVYFANNGTSIGKKALPSLDSVAAILIKYTSAQLLIEGHTDNVGSAAGNKMLSQKRANAIKAYFVQKGIAESRLRAVGLGLEKPLGNNATALGRALNRRVEMKTTYEYK